MNRTGALPVVHRADITPDELDALLRDVELCAELLGVSLKGGPRAHADDTPTSLAEARRLLASGGVRGVQLRYRHEGAQWWDTVLCMPSGFRLVRIRHDF